MSDRLYTTNQLAKLFGVVPTTVIDWIEAGKLEAFKTLGGHRRITHVAVLDFLRRNKLSSPPAFSNSTNKILFLDDEPDVLRSFQRLLTKQLEGTEILVSEHPVDALVRIGAEKPKVVIFDIYMPDMDGFEFCRRLRDSHGKELKLIAISGNSSAEVKDKVLNAGADMFIEKTDAVEKLASACRELA